jgi:hypothetical protein
MAILEVDYHYLKTSAVRAEPRRYSSLADVLAAYVCVVIEHCSRRLIHCNVTAHPSAAWTLQQLREAIGLQDR